MIQFKQPDHRSLIILLASGTERDNLWKTKKYSNFTATQEKQSRLKTVPELK